MIGLSDNLTKTVFVYCVFVNLYLCIWVSDTWEHCFRGPCTISFSKIYHITGLSGFRAISGMDGWDWDGLGSDNWGDSMITAWVTQLEGTKSKSKSRVQLSL